MPEQCTCLWRAPVTSSQLSHGTCTSVIFGELEFNSVSYSFCLVIKLTCMLAEQVMMFVKIGVCLVLIVIGGLIIWWRTRRYYENKKKESEDIPFEWDSITPWDLSAVAENPETAQTTIDSGKSQEQEEDEVSVVNEIDLEYDEIIPWH